MQMKKVFFPPWILLLEGRLLCLMMAATVSLFPLFPLWEWLKTGTVSSWGWNIAAAILSQFAWIPLREFWPQCFSRLTLTNDTIIWRCFFMRPRKIAKDVCHYIGIKEAMVERGKGKWVSTGTRWVWFSVKPFPEGKNISQLRTKKEFIKFPLSVRLSGALGEWVPEPKNLPFVHFYEVTQREKKRRVERRIRKREKRRRERSDRR